MLCEDRGGDVPIGKEDKANLIDFTVRRQRRAARSTFTAEFTGLVDRIEQVLLLECALHQIYLGTAHPPELMIDLLERGLVHPPLYICAGSRAVYDVIGASDACESAGSRLNLRLVSVRGRMAYGLTRQLS